MISRHVYRIVTFLLATTPVAADQLGTITAQFDGEPKEWFAISMEQSGGVIGTAYFKELGRG